MSEVAYLICKNSTNQLTLGAPDFYIPTTTISAPLPASNRIVTVPDALGNSNLVLSTQSTVTQATSISTAVTLNASSGNITTVSVSTAASTAVGTFTLNNSFITTSSVVLASVSGGSYTTGSPVVVAGAVAAGSVTFTLSNISTTAALNGTVKVSFLVC